MTRALLQPRRDALIQALARVTALVLLAAPIATYAADGWFVSADRQAMRAFAEGDFAQAEALFEDSAWKAAAAHRQGRYFAAARLLEDSQSPRDRYNRATALALAGEIENAIRLYEALLRDHPGHADARHNLELLKQHTLALGGAPARPDEGTSGSVDEPLAQESPDLAPAPLADSEAVPDAPLLEEQTQRWLMQVPDDPGGLLRRKFERQYRALGVDQDGRPLWPGETAEPW